MIPRERELREKRDVKRIDVVDMECPADYGGCGWPEVIEVVLNDRETVPVCPAADRSGLPDSTPRTATYNVQWWECLRCGWVSPH